MQCPKCDYIRFKSAPKCVNCGFDFKKKKSTSEALGESESEFTIFAAAGALAAAVSDASSPEMNFHEPLSSEELVDSQEPSLDEHDSSLESQEAYIQESGDFDLDLSGMDIEDSEDWVVGATLTEDLAEISNFDSKDSLENSMQESNEFAVQGLGFNVTEDTKEVDLVDAETAPPEENASLDSELTVLDEEMAVQEMEPYASKSEIKFESESEDLELTESSIEEVVEEEIDPSQSLDAPVEDSEDISLEVELKLDTEDSELDLAPEDAQSGETTESALDSQDDSIELDPMLELEDLDLALEIDSPEVENASQTSEATLEDQDLIEGARDDDAPLLPEDNPKQD